MKLSEILDKAREDTEFTVWDKDYDIETYFYATKGGDEWDKAMYRFAGLLEVTEISNRGIMVNMSDLIESKIEELEKSELFIQCDVDAIMEDIESILSGNVSEKWLVRFVDVLEGEKNDN